jgi:protein tyrosine kinase modulator
MIGHRQLTMEDYLAILRRHKWALIAFVVLCPIAGYTLSFFMPKEYTSQTTILVEQPAITDQAITEISSADLKQRLTTLQEQILSRSRLEALIEKFNLFAEERKAEPMESLVDRLRKKISVTPVKPMAESNSTQLPGFTIRVANHDPALAQKLCSEVSAMFLAENRRLRHEQAQETTEFISQELADAKAKMDEHDRKLAAFKERYLGELPDDQQANLGILSGLNQQLDAATQAVIRAQQDKTFAETMLQQQAVSQNGDSAQSLQKELSDRQTELAALQNRYTPEHPDVVKLKMRIADLKEKIAESSKAGAPAAPATASVVASNPQIDQLRAQIHQYDSVIKEETAQQRAVQQKIAKYEGRVQLSPNVEQQYRQLTRDSQAATEFYNSLLKKRSESAMASDINHQKQTGEFRVLDVANLPASPSFPNHMYFGLGGLGVGVFLGLALVVLGEARDKTLRTEQDVEFFLQLPTLANIPSVAAAQRNAAKAGKEGPRLVANA